MIGDKMREEAIRRCEDGVVGDELFYSLVRLNKNDPKKRKCLVCGKLFESRNSGHRYCPKHHCVPKQRYKEPYPYDERI